MLLVTLPTEHNTRLGVEPRVLEDRVLLELQLGSQHRTTGSQDEQGEQADDKRVGVELPES